MWPVYLFDAKTSIKYHIFNLNKPPLINDYPTQEEYRKKRDEERSKDKKSRSRSRDRKRDRRRSRSRSFLPNSFVLS